MFDHRPGWKEPSADERGAGKVVRRDLGEPLSREVGFGEFKVACSCSQRLA